MTLTQIDRYELAIKVGKSLQLQRENSEKVMAKIDKAYAARLEQIDADDFGKFAAIGTFATSAIYDWRVVDGNSGKILCYAFPTEAVSQTDLNEYVGKKIGLIGTIEALPQTSGAGVHFTEIVELK